MILRHDYYILNFMMLLVLTILSFTALDLRAGPSISKDNSVLQSTNNWSSMADSPLASTKWSSKQEHLDNTN